MNGNKYSHYLEAFFQMNLPDSLKPELLDDFIMNFHHQLTPSVTDMD